MSERLIIHSPRISYQNIVGHYGAKAIFLEVLVCVISIIFHANPISPLGLGQKCRGRDGFADMLPLEL